MYKKRSTRFETSLQGQIWGVVGDVLGVLWGTMLRLFCKLTSWLICNCRLFGSSLRDVFGIALILVSDGIRSISRTIDGSVEILDRFVQKSLRNIRNRSMRPPAVRYGPILGKPRQILAGPSYPAQKLRCSQENPKKEKKTESPRVHARRTVTEIEKKFLE